MGKALLKLAGAVSFVLAVTGCGSGIEKWESANSARYRVLKPGSDLLGVTVPVLRSRGLEQVWGSPKIQRDGEGGYTLTYADPKKPFTRLVVHGMTEPLPRLSSPPKLSGEEMRNNTLAGYERDQPWRTVTIAEQKVRWFQESASGGADGAYFSTEGFTLKAADGRKGHYRLVAENGDDAAEAVARWFGSVSF
ncbi:hypothetical protein OKA04_21830 [Luteolibacter flavescens]|uniref:Lipoprotein n=1 Tax=Luteolibacter flavescens TaxID=1859460 RepID=A0ABT3FUZ3_9BACT|nr:hypothetical protein [Luteolibacter flavescens]MCW1887393.1 hypothetical protein [Luteolibacter flavescens]